MQPVALTMGDAAGIGPEIILKIFDDPSFTSRYPCFVVGDAGTLERTGALVAPQVSIREIQSAGDFRYKDRCLNVLNVSHLPASLQTGRIQKEAGAAAYEAIRTAIGLAMSGSVQAICTAPINKESLALAGIHHPGHTEILADLSHTADYAMMLVNPELRTILVTIHCSLADVIRQITYTEELRIIRLAHRTLKGFGIDHPRIAVAGLNPHAGEGGLFGREELDIIGPAIATAQADGIAASGPHPGDTVFMRARCGEFDVVVAQYHDQALIPVKYLGVENGVNITAGLPFVRTSPDHGTAFDIAGKGLADPSSLRNALACAHDLVRTGPSKI